MDLNNFQLINWIASFPKSGNTWMRLLMDAYFLGDVDINDIQTSWGDGNVRYYALDNLSPARYPQHIQMLLRPSGLTKMVLQYINNGKHVPLFLKTHSMRSNVGSVSLIPYELTKSVIYLVRDPRDIVPSYAAHMGYTYEEAIESMAKEDLVLAHHDLQQISGLTGSWGQNVRSWVNANGLNAGLIKYEDLKAAPEKALTYALNHIGIEEPDKAKIKKAVKICELSKIQAQEKQTGFGEQSRHNTQFFGAKHKRLTIAQRRTVERLFHREMTMLGYL